MSTFSPAEEREVRRLLASKLKADQNQLSEWLAMLPGKTASDMLVKIASDAPHSHGVLVAILMITALLCIVNLRSPTSLGITLLVGFAGTLMAQTAQQSNRQVARKAAFLLSYRDDSRAVAPLVKLWKVHPPVSVAAVKEHEKLEFELTRLLTALTDRGGTQDTDAAVIRLLRRALPPLPKRPRILPEDFSESRADLLLAALRYLTHQTMWKASPQKRDVVADIAAHPVLSFTPNRSLIYETAAAYLDPQPIVRTISPATPIAQSIGIWL